MVKKNLPTILDTWVQSLGREDALEKGMATHSTALAWRVPGTEEHTVHGVAQSWPWLSLSPFFKSKQAANVYKARESQMKWRNEDNESKKNNVMTNSTKERALS